MLPPELAQQFNLARQRILDGQALSPEEQARLTELIRQGRHSAAEAGAKSRTKKADAASIAKGISDDDLDAQLKDLGI